MTGTDFSRIGELFYDSVGEQPKEATLVGFMRDACGVFAERYLHGGTIEGARLFRYPSDTMQYHLQLRLVAHQGKPDISGVTMEGKSDNLATLLTRLRGTLYAEFTGIPLDDVVATFHLDADQAIRERHVLAGSLGLDVSQTQEGSYVVRTAALQECVRKRFRARYIPARLDKTTLDAPALRFLARAAHIVVTHAGYAMDDPDQLFIPESCNIIQPEPGCYHWRYDMHTSNERSLSHDVLPHLQALFELGRSDFSLRAFHRLTVVEPGQASLYQGGEP